MMTVNILVIIAVIDLGKVVVVIAIIISIITMNISSIISIVINTPLSPI